jgi:tetratricopeptide (TPR) repeat protein
VNRPGPGGGVGGNRPGGGNWGNGGGNWNGGRPNRPGQGGQWHGQRPGYGRHNRWVNGYWNGFRDGYWAGSWNNNWGWGGGGWGFGPAFGWGFGTGLGSALGWGLGGGLLGWGGGWGWGPGWGWASPGWGWGGGGWGFGPGFGTGLGWGVGSGLGWGLSSWLFGSPCYTWGYSSFVNPYVVYASPIVVTAPATVLAYDPLIDAVGQVGSNTVVYDYSQPLNTQAPEAPPEAADPAVAQFDQARAAVKQGQYEQALALADRALASLPNDATIHEFRALCQFAQGKYGEAAATLYAVLAAGPGWDWPTLIGLYPDVTVYTGQIRALEAYRDQHADDAAPHFLCAYHYLTQGHKDAAIAELKAVTRLEPRDKLSAQLLAGLQGQPAPKITVDALPPTPDAADAARPAADPLADLPALAAPAGGAAADAPSFPLLGTGRWVARPDDDTTITLEMKDENRFTWTVERKGQKPTTIEGDAADAKGVLTLNTAKQGALVGRVAWAGEGEFTFRLLGAPDTDPGLTFRR